MLPQEFRAHHFIVVDVGAKDKLESLPGIDKTQIRWIGFEPQTETTKSNFDVNVQYFPFALSDKIGEASFYLANNPSFSSLLKLDLETFKKHCSLMPGFEHWYRGIQTRNVVQVKTATLDQICLNEQIQTIDILKIDTQGTELSVLKGALQMLALGKVLMIKVEFSQVLVYENQCTFSEIDIFLKSLDFDLVEYKVNADAIIWRNTNEKSPDQIRLGNGGDAYYVLKSEKLNQESRLKAALLLASKGFFSEAKYYLESSGIDSKVVELVIQHFYFHQPDRQFKLKVKRLIPPALLSFLKSLR